MRVTIGFQELISALGYANAVLSDKSVDDKAKNVVFLCTMDGVRTAAYNVFTHARTVVDSAICEGIDGEWRFQLKANELNKIISAFSNLYKTEVKSVAFEDSGVRIKVIVHEVAKNEGDERLNRDSTFELENAPIAEAINKELHNDFPEETSGVVSGDLLLYIDSLLPLMSNDSANSVASKLNFADDYVFCISSHRSAFFQNRLPVEFKGLCLGYSSVSFIKKLAESEELVSVSRTDKYLCVESGSTQAFMRYNAVKVNYKVYIQMRSKDVGVVVDRLYFRDVLKRMGILSADGTVEIKEDKEMLVENAQFQQLVPLENVKGGAEGIKFKVSIPVMEELILGNDAMFPDPLFIYFVKSANGYTLYISDKRGVWFTSARVLNA